MNKYCIYVTKLNGILTSIKNGNCVFYQQRLKEDPTLTSDEYIKTIVGFMTQKLFCDDDVFDAVCEIESKCDVSVYYAMLLYYFIVVENCDIEKFW